MLTPEPECAPIPAGEFRMGCERGRDDEKPAHCVWVDAFEMAVTPVTREEYARFCEATRRALPPDWANPDFDDPRQPVVSVSWLDAVAYCEWLSRAAAGRRYRLPTEAEWERTARGGREDELYPWGDAEPRDVEAYRRRWMGDVRGPRPVAEKPNAYGVFDLCENVHEWCADWYDPGFYAVSPERNPAGPAEGKRRASRGGSWRHHIKVSRCAARSSIPPEFKYADYGFRVVR